MRGGLHRRAHATVRNAAFAPSFFGSVVVTAIAAALHVRHRRERCARWIFAGLALCATAFVITFAISVPLNDDLAALGPPDAIEDMTAARSAYEEPWVRANIARTIAATGALACLVRALMIRGVRDRAGETCS